MSVQTEMKIYEEQINIPLLNEVISFVGQTAKINSKQRNELRSRCMFYQYSADWLGAVQEKYGFLYLGEMLERYEERFSMPIADLRAIALALGYTNRFQTDDMFVGNQKTVFIQKVRRLSAQDVFLTGAMYLLTEGTSESPAFSAKLLGGGYTRTEDILFALSLFPSFEDTFTALRASLTALLGTGRTIPVLGNTGAFDWLIPKLQPLLKKAKTKDMAIFRALCALPCSHVKKGDRNHDILLQHGYTDLEIAYLNAMEVQYQTAANVLRSDSIVTEKIIISLFNEVLAARNSFEEDIYDQLSILYRRYEKFSIKCNGVKELIDAIHHDVRIQNCDTFRWLTRHVPVHHELFHVFDILDTKWDSLVGTLENDMYRELFDEHLNKEMDAADIQKRIQRYNQLTGRNYRDWYFTISWGGPFEMLVEKGVFDLWQLFQSSLDETGERSEPQMLKRLRSYLYELKSIHAFRFYEQFLPQYGFSGLERYFTFEQYNKFNFSDGLARQKSYNLKSIELTAKRNFLTEEEQQKLLFWLEEYFFRCKSDTYLLFVVELISKSEYARFIPCEHLRGLFDLIIDQPDLLSYQEKRALKEMYLTEAEKIAEAQAEAHAKQLEKERIQKEREQSLISDYQAMKDRSFASMLKFLDRHKHHDDLYSLACHIVYENLYPLVIEKLYVLDRQESAQFLHLCSRLIAKRTMHLTEAQDLFSKIKEEPDHVAQSDDIH